MYRSPFVIVLTLGLSLSAWAKNFTIICWPIANAILPKDLQRHLAGVLFEISHLFSPAILSDPLALGALIEAHSEWTNSRFRQFAQQHAADEPVEIAAGYKTALLDRVRDRRHRTPLRVDSLTVGRSPLNL